MTYSFPCTDLSVAGKMQGMSKADWENGNSTRSGLLWEVERILKECSKEELPQVLLMENVPQVHADQNKQDFENWLSFLRSRGYVNHYADLNAKDYGIPQNRDRCFCVSFLSDTYVDFQFPNAISLNTVMRDFLEPEVDEKYYINSEKAQKLIQQLIDDGTLPEQRTENREFCARLTSLSRVQKSEKSQTVSAQKSTAESQISGQRVTVSLNYNEVEKFDMSIAKTLCARDYKGFTTGFQFMNGVIEKCK